MKQVMRREEEEERRRRRGRQTKSGRDFVRGLSHLVVGTWSVFSGFWKPRVA